MTLRLPKEIQEYILSKVEMFLEDIEITDQQIHKEYMDIIDVKNSQIEHLTYQLKQVIKERNLHKETIANWEIK